MAKKLLELGYHILATQGTSAHLAKQGVHTEVVSKLGEGRSQISDKIRAKQIQLIINTPTGKGPMVDEAKIRSLATSFRIPCVTTMNAAQAMIAGIESFRRKGTTVKTLQDYLGLKPARGKELHVR